MPKAQPRRLEGFAAGLAAILNAADLKPEWRAAIIPSEEALRQGDQFLASVPIIIQERTATIALDTSMKCAEIILSVADDYESGRLPPETPGSALRKVAVAIAKSQQEIAAEKAGLQPKRQKSRLIGVG